MEKSTTTSEQAKDRFETLLPFYVNGQIDAEDREFCEAHLRAHHEGNEELEAERALAQLIRDSEDAPVAQDGDEAWAAFSKALVTDSQPSLPKLRQSKAAGVNRWRRSSERPSRTKWLVGAQSVAMIAMAVLLLPAQLSQPEGSYTTLSGEASSERGNAGNAIVRFAPEITEARMRAVLFEADATIVNGPLEDGSYLIDLADDGQNGGLEALRNSEGVDLAESLTGGAS